MTRGSANKRKQRGMTAHQAARLLLRLAIHHAIADLVEDEAPDYAREEYATARRRIEATVRRVRKVPVRDLTQLRDDLVNAVPQSHRERVVAALSELRDAEDDEDMVQRDINYFIGVAVGQTLRGGESWDYVSWRDAVPSQRRRRRHKHR